MENEAIKRLYWQKYEAEMSPYGKRIPFKVAIKSGYLADHFNTFAFLNFSNACHLSRIWRIIARAVSSVIFSPVSIWDLWALPENPETPLERFNPNTDEKLAAMREGMIQAVDEHYAFKLKRANKAWPNLQGVPKPILSNRPKQEIPFTQAERYFAQQKAAQEMHRQTLSQFPADTEVYFGDTVIYTEAEWKLQGAYRAMMWSRITRWDEAGCPVYNSQREYDK